MTDCKDCEKRAVGCHADCPDYQAFLKENEERRKIKQMIAEEKRSDSLHRARSRAVARIRNGRRGK